MTDYSILVYEDRLTGGFFLIGHQPSITPKKYKKRHLDILLQLGIDVWYDLADNEVSNVDYKSEVYEKTKTNIIFNIINLNSEKHIGADKYIFRIADEIDEHVKNGKKVFASDCNFYEKLSIPVSCFFMKSLRLKMDEACKRTEELLKIELKKDALRIISRYKPPVKVIISGDRNSSFSFRSTIKMELKHLPKGSLVIHGDCKGIDKLAGKIASEMNIEVKKFPISSEEWKLYGLRAGPMRNKKMLDESPDMVYAFHPEIEHSKGTKDMILQSYERNIPVYIFDGKTKIKYEGQRFEDI